MRADGVQICFDATSAYVHAENSAQGECAGRADDRPDAGGDRPVLRAAGEPQRARRQARDERQHGDLRRPGDDPDGRGRHRACSRSPTARSSPRSPPSRSGPGTRKNIDEFTRTTAGAVEKVGGAAEGKAIIIINPAEPPLIMRDTIHCLTEDEPDQAAITRSIHDDGRRGAEVRARLRAGERPGVRRQARVGVHGGRGPGRLPAQVRRQPRHHDRRGRCAPPRCSPRKSWPGKLVLDTANRGWPA